jgi:hypothetical protein
MLRPTCYFNINFVSISAGSDQIQGKSITISEGVSFLTSRGDPQRAGSIVNTTSLDFGDNSHIP